MQNNKELNSKAIEIIYSDSLGNPNPLKAILLKAIERKHSPHNKPNQSITSANSSQAILKTTSVVIG